jgi:hypothetical protein
MINTHKLKGGEKMSTVIELDDLVPKHTELPQHWNDWYFATTFEHDGKDYFLVQAITEGTFMGGPTVGLGLAADLFSPVQEGDAYVVGTPEKQIAIQKLQPPNAFNHTADDNAITVEMDDLKAICRPDEQTIFSGNETINGQLTFTPRGPVLRWGNKKDGQCAVVEKTSVSGVESLSEVRGTVAINGEEIDVKGRGVFEHVWIKALEFMNIRVMDWVYLNADEMYMFLCHCESISEDGTPYHFEDGSIYVLPKDDHVVAKKIDFVPENWVYLKPCRRFIPSRQKVTATTDKGTLETRISLSLYPQISQPVRMEPLTMHNITGWNMMFFDTPIEMEGKFIYANGDAVELTNGTGVNEQLRILPL